jgi:hypothetical protein
VKQNENSHDIVAYLLKVKIVEPGKQPLLANASEKQHSFVGNGREADNGTTSVARQQILDKRQLNGNNYTNNRGKGFFCAVLPRCYNRDGLGQPVLSLKSVCDEKT